MLSGSLITRPILRPGLHLGEERFLMFILDELAHDLEQRSADVIRLTLGKSELPPCGQITGAMIVALASPTRQSLVFPAGLPELRARLSEEYRALYGVSLAPENFIVSVGTSSAFRNLNYLLAGPGDEVLIPLPYYPLYRFCASLVGAKVTHYRINPASLAMDIASFEAAFTPCTKIVVINSPGNPLGNVVDLGDLLAIDEIIDGRATIICDEIYANTYFDRESFSAVQALPSLRSPLVVTNGFSKGYRMYARRVGYSVVPDVLVEPLTVIQHHTLLTVDPVPQFGAIAALEYPKEVQEIVSRYRHRRDYSMARFQGVQGVTPIHSKGGFYLTLECGDYMRSHGIETGLDLAIRLLPATQVATVPGEDFGLPTSLRLSFSSGRYEEGVDRLATFLTGAG